MKKEDYQKMKIEKINTAIKKTRQHLEREYDSFLCEIDTIPNLTMEKLDMIEKEVNEHPENYCQSPDPRNAAYKAAKKLNIHRG